MSGYLPNHTNIVVTPGLEDLPIYHAHGQNDPLVYICIYVYYVANIYTCIGRV